jgi:hypothetical protein
MGAEGSIFWLSVITDLQIRGVQDVFLAAIDGLSAFKDAIHSVFPKTKVQRCIIHQIRYSLKYVVWKDRKAFTADRSYDDSRNHYWLEQTGIQSSICLNTYRTHKKDANKEVWLELKASAAYQTGLKERYKIERKFGECKQQHGFGRCRYRGLDRYRIQAELTAIALNLKRMVKLLYGVNFRNPAPILA